MWHNEDFELPAVPLVRFVVYGITLLPHTAVWIVKRQGVKHSHHLRHTTATLVNMAQSVVYIHAHIVQDNGNSSKK